MNEGALKNRRILVTGGATGIGRAICLRLAAEGAEVIVGHRTRDQAAQEVVRAIEANGGLARAARADVTHATEVADLFAAEANGGIQAVVHAASAPLNEARFTRAEWGTFQSHIDVALKGGFNLARAFAAQPDEAQPAALIFILSSVTLGVPPAEKAAYTAAKYALLGLAKTLAVELAARRIRVNCVSPGFVETPLTAHVDPRLKEMIARAVPLKRLAGAEEVASAVAFLAHPENAYITGANLPVAGGSAM